MDHLFSFFCVICNCCLYRTSVICFNIETHIVDKNIIFMVKLKDNNYYCICTTCDKALQKNSVVYHVRLLGIDYML